MLEAPLSCLSGRIHVTSDPRQYQSRPLGHRPVVAEDPDLLEHPAAQRGLAVVDKGENLRSSILSFGQHVGAPTMPCM